VQELPFHGKLLDQRRRGQHLKQTGSALGLDERRARATNKTNTWKAGCKLYRWAYTDFERSNAGGASKSYSSKRAAVSCMEDVIGLDLRAGRCASGGSMQEARVAMHPPPNPPYWAPLVISISCWCHMLVTGTSKSFQIHSKYGPSTFQIYS